MALEREESVAKLINNFMINTRKTAKQKQTQGYFGARKTLLEEYWRRYSQAREDVINMVENTENAESRHAILSEGRFTSIESTYCEAMGELNDNIEALIRQQSPSIASTSSGISTPQMNVVLPKIELPKFDGNLLKWLNFKDLFETCIIKETALSNVQRLHYLKVCLQGDAEHLLRNLSITEHNVQIAWELLTQRYDSTRRLIRSHLRAITDLPKMHSESHVQIRNTLDVVNETYRALSQLGRPVSQWDDWFVFHMTEKLDSKTVKDWEISLESPGTIPTYDELTKFLKGRAQGLEAVTSSIKSNNITAKTTTMTSRPANCIRSHQTNVNQCACCTEKHILPFCPSFRKLLAAEKLEIVRKANLCDNCLKNLHTVDNCSSKYTCRKCEGKHHTLIHDCFATRTVTVNHHRVKNESQPTTTGLPTVLLATAFIKVRSPSGYDMNVRALLDPGSQATFISEFAAQKLHLPRTPVSVPITGVGNASVGKSKSVTEFTLQSLREPQFNIKCGALILPRLGHRIPATHIDRQSVSDFSGLMLADPEFTEPGLIDVIIGADIYGSLLYGELKRSADNAPVAQNTHLGWVVYGPTSTNKFQQLRTTFCAATTLELNDLVQQMWTFNQNDDLPTPNSMTMDELYCEEFFERTTRRDKTGRFSVRYPFKNSANLSALADSKRDALILFGYQQKRLQRDTTMQTLYKQFMAEYVALGHMQQVVDEVEPQTFCYIPHHSVYKESSSTTKLRTVFNASRKYNSGISLNDCLHTGPKLQNDLASLLIQWRSHRIAFMADIEKCFRQIRVHEDDIDMQRIFWQDDNGDPQIFRLLTVTYGLNCSPYLTIKVLHTLAKEEEAEFPVAAKILRDAFYMDDCLYGSDTVSEAVHIRHEIQQLLHRGGFLLRKWHSNSSDFLKQIPTDTENTTDAFCDLTLSREAKALGIYWSCSTDCIGYQINLTVHDGPITKRQQLSDVARTYDPLGLLAPTITLGKIMFQELWTLGCSWDDRIPEPHQARWHRFRTELPLLESLKINRWVFTPAKPQNCQLHVFADASTLAYAAVCYIRVVEPDECIKLSILMAKTKVAPLRKITVPCLELNAALLAAKLAVKVIQALNISTLQLYCWSDSKTALSWIRSNPGKQRQYIANRLIKIQEMTPIDSWKFVSTKCNPADVATRGVFPSELIDLNKWWSGPTWLKLKQDDWPIQPSQLTPPDGPESLTITTLATITTEPLREALLQNYSNINKLLAVTSWCRRFLAVKLKLPHSTERWCTSRERTAALNLWVRYVQNQNFSNEISCLRQGKPLPSKSKLKRLNPVIDGEGLLRVNGRLRNAFGSDAERFPVILPKDNKLTTLLIAQAHECTLHGGTQSTLNLIRRRFWPINGRTSVKKYIRRCIKCFRHNCKPAQQIMGALPAPRCTPTKPFTHCGIDYGGPYKVRTSKGRGYKAHKAYVALFVCLSTRALHIELVSDLTTETFIMALRRFFSTRGYCSDIYSDCATTFVGANTILKEDIVHCRKQLEAGARYSELHEVTWHFIPPGSPNFGGIWEAGIESMKHHLKRTIGEATLTFEELYTLLKEIEAVLNSRPLAAISDDPDDFNAITPAHFLTGHPLIVPPEPNVLNINTTHLTRWKQIKQMQQDFWNRWSFEYLKELQVRHKWQQSQNNLKVGDLVLLRDERLPPTQWQLGRVTQVHPGDDSHVRVATIRTKSTFLKRAISKLVALPIEDNERSHTVGGSLFRR